MTVGDLSGVEQAHAHEKLARLQAWLTAHKRVAVALSGGVDSTFLVGVAHEVMGERVCALTVRSELVRADDVSIAEEFCTSQGIAHAVIAVDVLSNDAIRSNPQNRCYHCKHLIFTRLLACAQERGALLVDGTNATDALDYRPGMRALEELAVASPLRAVGLSKDEIRLLAHERGYATWDSPASACLATRIPYDVALETAALSRIDRAETFLRECGFRQNRVRIEADPAHDCIYDQARIELLPKDFDRFFDEDMQNRVREAFARLGFTHTTLDTRGYRMGSMNEALVP